MSQRYFSTSRDIIKRIYYFTLGSRIQHGLPYCTKPLRIFNGRLSKDLQEKGTVLGPSYFDYVCMGERYRPKFHQ